MRFIDLLLLYINNYYKPSNGFVILGQSDKIKSQQNTIVISETGGQAARQPDLLCESRVQVYVQATTDILGHTEILKLESFLANRFNADVIDKTGKVVGKISAINPVDRPIQLGSNGIVYQYVQNYEISWFKSNINKEIL